MSDSPKFPLNNSCDISTVLPSITPEDNASRLVLSDSQNHAFEKSKNSFEECKIVPGLNHDQYQTINTDDTIPHPINITQPNTVISSIMLPSENRRWTGRGDFLSFLNSNSTVSLHDATSNMTSHEEIKPIVERSFTESNPTDQTKILTEAASPKKHTNFSEKGITLHKEEATRTSSHKFRPSSTSFANSDIRDITYSNDMLNSPSVEILKSHNQKAHPFPLNTTAPNDSIENEGFPLDHNDSNQGISTVKHDGLTSSDRFLTPDDPIIKSGFSGLFTLQASETSSVSPPLLYNHRTYPEVVASHRFNSKQKYVSPLLPSLLGLPYSSSIYPEEISADINLENGKPKSSKKGLRQENNVGFKFTSQNLPFIITDYPNSIEREPQDAWNSFQTDNISQFQSPKKSTIKKKNNENYSFLSGRVNYSNISAENESCSHVKSNSMDEAYFQYSILQTILAERLVDKMTLFPLLMNFFSENDENVLQKSDPFVKILLCHVGALGKDFFIYLFHDQSNDLTATKCTGKTSYTKYTTQNIWENHIDESVNKDAANDLLNSKKGCEFCQYDIPPVVFLLLRELKRQVDLGSGTLPTSPLEQPLTDPPFTTSASCSFCQYLASQSVIGSLIPLFFDRQESDSLFQWIVSFCDTSSSDHFPVFISSPSAQETGKTSKERLKQLLSRNFAFHLANYGIQWNLVVEYEIVRTYLNNLVGNSGFYGILTLLYRDCLSSLSLLVDLVLVPISPWYISLCVSTTQVYFENRHHLATEEPQIMSDYISPIPFSRSFRHSTSFFSSNETSRISSLSTTRNSNSYNSYTSRVRNRLDSLGGGRAVQGTSALLGHRSSICTSPKVASSSGSLVPRKMRVSLLASPFSPRRSTSTAQSITSNSHASPSRQNEEATASVITKSEDSWANVREIPTFFLPVLSSSPDLPNKSQFELESMCFAFDQVQLASAFLLSSSDCSISFERVVLLIDFFLNLHEPFVPPNKEKHQNLSNSPHISSEERTWSPLPSFSSAVLNVSLTKDANDSTLWPIYSGDVMTWMTCYTHHHHLLPLLEDFPSVTLEKTSPVHNSIQLGREIKMKPSIVSSQDNILPLSSSIDDLTGISEILGLFHKILQNVRDQWRSVYSHLIITKSPPKPSIDESTEGLGCEFITHHGTSEKALLVHFTRSCMQLAEVGKITLTCDPLDFLSSTRRYILEVNWNTNLLSVRTKSTHPNPLNSFFKKNAEKGHLPPQFTSLGGFLVPFPTIPSSTRAISVMNSTALEKPDSFTFSYYPSSSIIFFRIGCFVNAIIALILSLAILPIHSVPSWIKFLVGAYAILSIFSIILQGYFEIWNRKLEKTHSELISSIKCLFQWSNLSEVHKRCSYALKLFLLQWHEKDNEHREKEFKFRQFHSIVRFRWLLDTPWRWMWYESMRIVSLEQLNLRFKRYPHLMQPSIENNKFENYDIGFIERAPLMLLDEKKSEFGYITSISSPLHPITTSLEHTSPFLSASPSPSSHYLENSGRSIRSTSSGRRLSLGRGRRSNASAYKQFGVRGNSKLSLGTSEDQILLFPSKTVVENEKDSSPHSPTLLKWTITNPETLGYLSGGINPQEVGTPQEDIIATDTNERQATIELNNSADENTFNETFVTDKKDDLRAISEMFRNACLKNESDSGTLSMASIPRLSNFPLARDTSEVSSKFPTHSIFAVSRIPSDELPQNNSPNSDNIFNSDEANMNVVTVRIGSAGSLIIPMGHDEPVIVDGSHIHRHLAVIGVEFVKASNSFSPDISEMEEAYQHSLALPSRQLPHSLSISEQTDKTTRRKATKQIEESVSRNAENDSSAGFLLSQDGYTDEDNYVISMWNNAMEGFSGLNAANVLDHTLSQVTADVASYDALLEKFRECENSLRQPEKYILPKNPVIVQLVHYTYGTCSFRFSVSPVFRMTENWPSTHEEAIMSDFKSNLKSLNKLEMVGAMLIGIPVDPEAKARAYALRNSYLVDILEEALFFQRAVVYQADLLRLRTEYLGENESHISTSAGGCKEKNWQQQALNELRSKSSSPAKLVNNEVKCDSNDIPEPDISSRTELTGEIGKRDENVLTFQNDEIQSLMFQCSSEEQRSKILRMRSVALDSWVLPIQYNEMMIRAILSDIGQTVEFCESKWHFVDLNLFPMAVSQCFPDYTVKVKMLPSLPTSLELDVKNFLKILNITIRNSYHCLKKRFSSQMVSQTLSPSGLSAHLNISSPESTRKVSSDMVENRDSNAHLAGNTKSDRLLNIYLGLLSPESPVLFCHIYGLRLKDSFMRQMLLFESQKGCSSPKNSEAHLNSDTLMNRTHFSDLSVPSYTNIASLEVSLSDYQIFNQLMVKCSIFQLFLPRLRTRESIVSTSDCDVVPIPNNSASQDSVLFVANSKLSKTVEELVSTAASTSSNHPLTEEVKGKLSLPPLSSSLLTQRSYPKDSEYDYRLLNYFQATTSTPMVSMNSTTRNEVQKKAMTKKSPKASFMNLDAHGMQALNFQEDIIMLFIPFKLITPGIAGANADTAIPSPNRPFPAGQANSQNDDSKINVVKDGTLSQIPNHSDHENNEDGKDIYMSVLVGIANDFERQCILRFLFEQQHSAFSLHREDLSGGEFTLVNSFSRVSELLKCGNRTFDCVLIDGFDENGVINNELPASSLKNPSLGRSSSPHSDIQPIKELLVHLAEDFPETLFVIRLKQLMTSHRRRQYRILRSFPTTISKNNQLNRQSLSSDRDGKKIKRNQNGEPTGQKNENSTSAMKSFASSPRLSVFSPSKSSKISNKNLQPTNIIFVESSVSANSMKRMINMVKIGIQKIRQTTNRKLHLEKIFRDHRSIPWTRGRVIGKGTFGSIYEVITVTGGRMAMKNIHFPMNLAAPDEMNERIETIMNEIEILSKVQHPNIIQYFYSEHGNQPGEVNIFMELCPHGSLQDFIRKKQEDSFSMSSIIHIIRGVCAALCYVHKNNVAHRDIKPANILMQGNTPKLADFGTAVTVQNELTEVAGTLRYMAPEVFAGEAYGMACDIWSVGCVLLDLLGVKVCDAMQQPEDEEANFDEFSLPMKGGVGGILEYLGGFFYDCTTEEEITRRLQRGMLVAAGKKYNQPFVVSELPPKIQNLFEFLEACFHFNPGRRSTAEELLSMPFLSDSTKERALSDHLVTDKVLVMNKNPFGAKKATKKKSSATKKLASTAVFSSSTQSNPDTGKLESYRFPTDNDDDKLENQNTSLDLSTKNVSSDALNIDSGRSSLLLLMSSNPNSNNTSLQGSLQESNNLKDSFFSISSNSNLDISEEKKDETSENSEVR